MYSISVISLISDGAKPNRRFYRMCQKEEKENHCHIKPPILTQVPTKIYFSFVMFHIYERQHEIVLVTLLPIQKVGVHTCMK